MATAVPTPVAKQPPLYMLHLPLVAKPEAKAGYAHAYQGLRPKEAAFFGVEWYYNYGLVGKPLDNGAEFVPFFWCDRYPANKYPKASNYFDSFERTFPDGYSGYMLFLNEPDLAGSDEDGAQCGRTPLQGAYIYKGLLEVCPDCLIVGPVTSHLDYYANWRWQREFFATITKWNLPLPAMGAIHTYTQGHDPTLIIDSYLAMLAEFGGSGEAWVTEFGFCSADDVTRAIEVYEGDSRIRRYAYFTARGYTPDCINWYDRSGDLNPAGLGWLRTRGTLPHIQHIEVTSGGESATIPAYP
jgi:hypothetical protein